MKKTIIKWPAVGIPKGFLPTEDAGRVVIFTEAPTSKPLDPESGDGP